MIQTRAGNEEHISFTCRERVCRGSEEAFTMKKEMVKKIRGEWIRGIYPLFPGYVFFETHDIEDLFYRLKRLPALTKIVRTGDEFTPLAPEEEDILRKLGGVIHIIKASAGFMEGDRVRIFDGPMKGMEGSILRINRHKSIAEVSIEFLGAKRKIPLALEIVAHDEPKKLAEILSIETKHTADDLQ